MASKLHQIDILMREGQRILNVFDMSPSIGRRWGNIEASLYYSANAMFTVHDIAKGDWIRHAPEYTETIITFYNETMEFILTGKPRIVPVNSWYSMLDDAIRTDIEKNGEMVLAGNIGATSMISVISDVKTNASPLQFKGQLSKDALSYAESELLFKWIMRENGLDDMLYSLSLFVLLFSSFKSN